MSDQRENGLFDNIPSFEWPDLDGKTLDISCSRDGSSITVAGINKSDGVIYILHQQFFPEKSPSQEADRLAGELADALERSIK
jgi:hypothetical protein